MLEDVSARGRYLVASYLTGSDSCTAVFDLAGSPRRLWSSCAYGPADGTSIDPSEHRLIVVPASWDGQRPFRLTILDLRTGRRVGEVPATAFWQDSTWVDPTHLLMESATDDTHSAFTIRECAVTDGAACHYLPGASAAHPAADAAAGTTY